MSVVRMLVLVIRRSRNIELCTCLFFVLVCRSAASIMQQIQFSCSMMATMDEVVTRGNNVANGCPGDASSATQRSTIERWERRETLTRVNSSAVDPMIHYKVAHRCPLEARSA